jgi:hypothetical protein
VTPLRVLAAALLTSAVAAAPAAAATPKPFGKLDCVARDGTRFCEGSVATRIPSFDGTPLDVNVTLPAGGDGPWPLVIGFHGFGSSKRGFDDGPPDHEGPKRFAQSGIAVLNPQSRGVRTSCGTLESRLADPVGCVRGWMHLDDVRFEIRDAQYLAGLLADEGLVEPRRIGAVADSYGGEPTLYLGLLRDRLMLGGLPGEADGRLVPWTSPKGRAMEVRAVAPYQTWADLPHVLMPNGRILDYAQAGPDASITPVGVAKETFVAGLFATGQAGTSGVAGYFAPPGVDPQSDLTSWTTRLLAGEPYDSDPVAMSYVRLVQRTRSPVLVPLDRRPAAMILGSGWADDLFPVDESLRIRSAIQAAWPDTPIGVYLADFGHQRTSNEKADMVERNAWYHELFEHELLGGPSHPMPRLGFRARPVTCPVGNGSGPLHEAPTWAALHPGEVRFRDATPTTVRSTGGDPLIAAQFMPLTANDPCKTVAATDSGEGTATYRLPPATGDGYTLMGAPTVIASLDVSGTFPQLDSRLWDIAPDGNQTLLVRNAYRPRGGGTPEPFQLAPAGWHVAAGHVLKLELLGNDAPHFRASNGVFTITVRDLELRLPVAESPGSSPPVASPSPPLFVDGAVPAADVAPPVSAVPIGRIRARVSYPRGCRGAAARIRLTGAGSRHVLRISVRRGRSVVARDRRRPFNVTVRRAAAGARGRATLRVTVTLRGGGTRTLAARVRFCAR